MIGYDHYIRQLSEIRGYFVGRTLSRKVAVESLFHTLPDTETLFEKGPSWIDRFMLLPLDIRGFGMNDAELDFWWLMFEKHKFSKKKGIPFVVRIYAVDQEIESPPIRRLRRIGAQVISCGKDYRNVYEETPAS